MEIFTEKFWAGKLYYVGIRVEIHILIMTGLFKDYLPDKMKQWFFLGSTSSRDTSKKWEEKIKPLEKTGKG